MNVQEALRKLPYKKRLYVRWRFGLDESARKYTIEDIMKMTGVQNAETLEKFEREEEFKHIAAIVLNSRMANDLIEIYDLLKRKASDGDIKSIDMLLKFQKELKQHKREAEQYFNDVDENEDDDDDLIL